MGIHWVAAIFFAAQAAPLAWLGSHADRQTVWSLCSGSCVQESINLLFSHPLIHMRVTENWKNWAVQFNPVYWFFFQCVLCISFHGASSNSLLYLRKYVIFAVCFSWWLKFRISLKLKAKAKLYWEIFLHVKFIVENALCWLEYCV
jgi:hypothetical protein